MRFLKNGKIFRVVLDNLILSEWEFIIFISVCCIVFMVIIGVWIICEFGLINIRWNINVFYFWEIRIIVFYISVKVIFIE